LPGSGISKSNRKSGCERLGTCQDCVTLSTS
jgi:hypothetical protein